MNIVLQYNYVHPKTGEKARLEYVNVDSFDDLDVEKVTQVYGVCFCNEEMVIVRQGLSWTLPGGTREPGEGVEQTLRREVLEETNMEILEWKPIGVQTVYKDNQEPYFQLRTACKVRPLGEFVHDPGGDVREIKLINYRDYKNYFDWGEIGDEIVKQAVIWKG